MALLHCFWDFEAYRAFKEAVRLDPDAPMPLMDRSSDHEKYHLRDAQRDEDSKEKPVNFMEQLVEKYPDDVGCAGVSRTVAFARVRRSRRAQSGPVRWRSGIYLAKHPDSAAVIV